MTQTVHKTLTAILGTAALCVASVGSTASASEYYTPANAPITYKMTNPAQMMGYGVPQLADLGLPQATGPAATFDQARIDPTLYAHQKIGNPYTILGQTYYPKHDPSYDMVGTASWYGDKFHGKMTASGETYDKTAMTAAHKTLPLNSLVVVTNLSTGQSLTLRINDRGPFVGNRLIDLSEAAASALGYRTSGLGDVRVQYAGPAMPAHTTPPQQAYRAPAPQAVPQYVAPAPQTLAPKKMAEAAPAPSAPRTYEPLRTLPEQFAPVLPTPQAPVQPQSAPQYAVPNLTAPVMPQTTLPQPPVAIPEAHANNTQNGDNTLTTLTIKGPIHMANHTSANTQPRLIKAVHRTTN